MYSFKTSSSGASEEKRTPWHVSWRELFEQIEQKEETALKLERCYNQIAEKVSNSGLLITDILKAGSFAKGTELNYRLELDVVVTVQNFEYDRVSEYLHTLANVFASDSSLVVHPSNIRVTSKALKFLCKNGVYVDLLPCGTLDPEKKLLSFLDKSKQYCTAAASYYQMECIRRQDEMYKNLVKAAKFWRDQKLSFEKGKWFSSYLIEVIMLHVYNNQKTLSSSSSSSFSNHLDNKISYDLLFCEFLKAVVSHKNLCIILPYFYSSQDVPAEILKGSRPLVLDVANPTNNLAAKVTDWSLITAYAQETLNWFTAQQKEQQQQQEAERTEFYQTSSPLSSSPSLSTLSKQSFLLV